MDPRRLLIAAGLALGPMAQLLRHVNKEDGAAQLLVIGAVVIALASWSRVLALIAAAAGAWQLHRQYDFFGPKLLFVCFGAIALAVFALGVVPLPQRRGATRPSRPSVVLGVPLVLADLFLVIDGFRPIGTSLLPPALSLAVGLGLASLSLVAPGAWVAIERLVAPVDDTVVRWLLAVDRFSRRTFRLIGTVVSRVLLSIVFVAIVVVPWLVQRVVRWDPTWSPSPRGSRWVARHPVAALPNEVWNADASSRSLRWRHRGPYVALVAVLVLVAGAVAWQRRTPGVTDDATVATDQSSVPPLSPGPWFDRYDASWQKLISRARLTQYVGTVLPDFSSTDINMADGVRRSWEPEFTCTDPLTVWVFGGSTLFGVAQRDGRTITSELARAAHAHGVDLRVENRGVPGDTAWQEERRLQYLYETSNERPDLVVFYDGFNDIQSVEWVYQAGYDPTRQFSSLNDSRLFAAVKDLTVVDDDGTNKYVGDVPDPNRRLIDDAVVVPAIEYQYAGAHRDAASLLAAAGTPFVHVYQPMEATRTPKVEGDWVGDAGEHRRVAVLRKHLPDGVVDISDVLDRDRRAYYLDEVHTTEKANPTIAARLWTEIEPTVTEIVSSKGASCS